MSDADYTYDVDGSVVTWDLTGMVRADPGDVEELLREMVAVSGEPEVTASVVRLPDEGSLGGDVLDVIEQYNEAFEDTDLSRTALVSTDVKNLAVKSRVDIDGVTIDAFDDMDSAVGWAREAA